MLAQRRCSGVALAQRAAERRPSVTSTSSAEQDDEQQADLLLDAERAQALGLIRRASRPQRDHRGARAIEEGALVLAGCERIGAPKVTVHRIGTGTTSPLGITRCTLSIQAGISCTSGNCSARWYRPALERLRLALVAARAFGKDHQRVAVAQRLDQRLERILVVGALPRLT